MSVQQDRFTFFGVMAAVVIVVLGYLQLSQLYPVAGNNRRSALDAADQAGEQHPMEAPGEEAMRP